MVSEVQVEDDRVAEELFKEQSCAAAAAATTTAPSGVSKSRFDTSVGVGVDCADDDSRWGDIYEDMPAKRKLALYDYDPAELSPNVDAEVRTI